MYNRKQSRLRRLRRVQQSAVKVIGGCQDTAAASPSGLTAESPAETAALYTVTRPPPPPPPPHPLDSSCGTGCSSSWTPVAVDLIECVDCAVEVAQKRIHRRRSSLRLSPVPLPATDTSKVGFCTCVRQSQTYRTPSTPSCFDSVGWVSDVASGLQKTSPHQSLSVSWDGIEEPPQAST